MATNFPTSLDNLTNPAGSDPVNNPSHASQHANINDAIENLEAKVGVNNSAVTTSLDYRVRQLETNPTYTNEMAQDAVAAALAAGTHTNITINYNDTGNSISISAAAGYTNEEAVDAVAAALTAGSGISISYNDPANTITISVDSTIATKTYVDTAVSNLGSTAASTYVLVSEVGQADGIATLDASGLIPDSQIPAGIARDSEVSSAISTAVNNLINSAPGTLDTLGEIATALAADESAAAALTTVVNGKVSKAGGDIIQSSLASTIPLVLKGAASQTANLQEWQTSAGAIVASIGPVGDVWVNGSIYTSNAYFGGAASYYNATINIRPQQTSYKGIVIQGRASQTGNLQEWQNSSANILAQVDAYGSASFGGNNVLGSSLGIGVGGNASQKGITVRGTASQTANLQEWQDSAGTIYAFINPFGQLSIGLSPTIYGNSRISINTVAATAVGQVIRGVVSQTADLQQWQNSAGAVLAAIEPTGSFYGSSITAYGVLTSNSSFRVNNAAAGTVAAIIKGAASQTADLQQWHDSAGTALLRINSAGQVQQPQPASTGLVVKAAPTLTATITNAVGSGTTVTYTAANTFTAGQTVTVTGVDPVAYNLSSVIIATATATTFTVTNAAVGTYVSGGIATVVATADLLQLQDAAGFARIRFGSSGSFMYNNGSSDIMTFAGTAGSTQIVAGGSIRQNANMNNSFGSGTLANTIISLGTFVPTNIALVVRGVASQTADLQQWRNNSGTVLAKVDSTGAMFTITPADSTNSTQVATTEYVKSNIANLVSSAPATLDTLNELATALGNDANFSTTITNSLAAKAPLASPTFTGIPAAPTATSGTNTTQIATTAFVKTAIDSSVQPGALYQTSAPTSPAVGQIWIDSDENVTTFDSNIIRRKAITATAGQTVFTADLPFIDGFEQIFMNGLLLVKTTDYAVSGGNTVTLTSGAAASDIIEIVSVTGANSVNTYTQAEVDALLAANTSVAPLSISANTTLVAKKRYFVTSASALTLTLPASPALNDEIQIVDASGNASTYNITVARNGNKINGGTGNLIIDNNGGWYTLLYTGSTYGWKVG